MLNIPVRPCVTNEINITYHIRLMWQIWIISYINGMSLLCLTAIRNTQRTRHSLFFSQETDSAHTLLQHLCFPG